MAEDGVGVTAGQRRVAELAREQGVQPVGPVVAGSVLRGEPMDPVEFASWMAAIRGDLVECGQWGGGWVRAAEFAGGALLPPSGMSFMRQDAVLNTAVLLRTACLPGLRVVVGPFPVRLGLTAEPCPDVLVVRYTDLLGSEDGLTGPPLLVVEVVSAETGPVDRTVKRQLYAAHGVDRYWIVDPAADALTVHALNRAEGRYTVEAEVVGEDRYQTSEPFPLSVAPAELRRGVGPH